MNFNELKGKALPHIIAISIFLIVTLVFYYPIIFEGKVLNQNDINQGVASNSEITEYRESTGEQILWTNSMFGGMPSYLISVRWDGDKILRTLQKIYYLGIPSPAGENFSMFLSFYILLLVFGVRPYMAIAGALVFGLSTFFMVSIEAGHMWKIRAIAYAPLVIAGIHTVYRGKYIRGFAFLALAMALEVNANHPQITYYLGFIIAIYGLVELYYSFKEKRLPHFAKASIIAILAVTIGIGANIGKLWSAYEYGNYSIRGKSELTSNEQSSGGLDRDYAFDWSGGIAETLTLLVPNYVGGASGQFNGTKSKTADALRRNNIPAQQIDQYERGLLGYWGPQPFTSGPAYLGAIVCFLFVVAFYYTDTKLKIWLVSASLLGILLSWGKNFEALNYFMFDHFPGYNKFRAVTMAITISLISMPLFAFIGLDKLTREKYDRITQKKLLIAFGIIGVVVLIILLFPNIPPVQGDLPSWLQSAVKADRQSIVRSDALRSLLFIILSIVFLASFFYKRIKYAALSFSLIFILFLDLGLVDKRFFEGDKFIKKRKNIFLQETPADKKILKDNSHYRVFNIQNPFNEARTSAHHHSIGGYHGAKMRRYQDLISNHLNGELQSIVSEKRLTPENTKTLSMLNAKYIIAGTSENAVITNPNANGNAWFVSKIKPVKSPDEEIASLATINPATEAVIDEEKFEIPELIYDTSSNIVLTKYHPDHLEYKSNSEEKGFALFSEIFYPKGWKAYIDDKEVDIVRANYVLRGLSIPAGKHKIEFKFEPRVFYVGNRITLISAILLLIVIVGTVLYEIRQLKKA